MVILEVKSFFQSQGGKEDADTRDKEFQFGSPVSTSFLLAD